VQREQGFAAHPSDDGVHFHYAFVRRGGRERLEIGISPFLA